MLIADLQSGVTIAAMNRTLFVSNMRLGERRAYPIATPTISRRVMIGDTTLVPCGGGALTKQ